MKKNLTESIERISATLSDNYRQQEFLEVEIGAKLPKRSEIIEIVRSIRKVMFPGYFGSENMVYTIMENFAGTTLSVIYEKLFKQIRTAMLYEAKFTVDVEEINDRAEELTLEFLEKIPYIQNMLMKDVQAELDGDPAAKSKEDIIFSYPGIFAIFVYRVAHELYELKVPFIPRIMSEYAHSKTGIDINPGAKIGEYFFIDHGTGIVIGETTVIGDHVKLYQGVTLGALSTEKGQELSGTRRHPTLEDHVVIYANTTVLGGDTVIGENSVIAGSTFITQSVPPNTKVSAYLPELKIKSRQIRQCETCDGMRLGERRCCLAAEIEDK